MNIASTPSPFEKIIHFSVYQGYHEQVHLDESKARFFLAQYATRDNADYIDQLWQQYKQDPSSVSTEWRKFFEGVEFASNGQGFSSGGGTEAGAGISEKELDVYHLITAYRNYGHFEADLDPLTNTRAPSDQLALSRFKLSEADLDQRFQIGGIIGKPNATLREILAHMRACYCGKLTVQCAEALPEIRNWFIREFEQHRETFKLSADQKKEILRSLTRTESLEKFINTRYVGAKRFSIEGGDALMPMMEWLANYGPTKGLAEIMIGMAHRGRVNILANFMGKGTEYIFADFNGPTEMKIPVDDFDGDVKYHLGYQTDRQTPNGPMRISLAFNPSHL
ncbi:MAG: hypothetical protein LCH95_20555, partial [Proteobacteria bacterium]|nr:hypothetical protein [Pseudomonadota bacterium]